MDFNKILDTPDSTAEFTAEDINAHKGYALLSYIWILVLIPILAVKDSGYSKYHANQGLILLIANIAWGVVSGVIRFVVGLIFGLIGLDILSTIFGLVLGLVNLVLIALMILGIYNAATGKAKELPLIGRFRILN